MLAKSSLVAVAMGMLVAGSAMAESYDVLFAFPQQYTEFTAAVPVQKFSVPGATLTKVVLTWNGTLNSTATLTNNNPLTAADLVKVQVDSTLTLKFDGVAAKSSATLSAVLLPPDGEDVIATLTPAGGSDTFTLDPASSLPKTLTLTSSNANLGLFVSSVGSESIMLNGSSKTYNFPGYSGGYVEMSSINTGDISGKVTYYYSAVPEAGTMLLGGCALMPILGYRRRSKKA